MKILVINPNSTKSMTDKIRHTAQKVAAAGTEVAAVNPSGTPASIEGHYDAALSIPALVEEVRRGEAAGFQGFVVACFDDPGIDACREVVRGPVIGICEASMKAASMIAARFSVVTTLPRTTPIVEELAVKYGMERYCRKVRAADLPVLSLEDDAGDARARVRREVAQAVETDGCEAVILGCAGMTDLADWLSQEVGVPVLDGVGIAVKMVEALIGAGLTTSKAGGYAAPREKASHA